MSTSTELRTSRIFYEEEELPNVEGTTITVTFKWEANPPYTLTLNDGKRLIDYYAEWYYVDRFEDPARPMEYHFFYGTVKPPETK